MAPVHKIVFDRIRPAEARNPADQADARALLDKAYGWLEQRLAGRAWAAGDAFSLADCAAAPSLHYADKVHGFRGRFPLLGAYLDRLEARPSVARVLKEAEPYAHMFPQEPA
jgi:glutathione S-transferase